MAKTRTFEVTTVVTDIRIDHDRLVVNAVDQGPDGQTVASHSFNEAIAELPTTVKAAAEKLVKHIEDWAAER